MKEIFSSLKKHYGEIRRAIQGRGVRMDGDFAVVEGLDLGFKGVMEAQVLESLEVFRAILSGDKEKEVAMRRLSRQQKKAGRIIPRIEVAFSSGPNTFFAEGITKILDVALGYATQQQNHYFLIGANDVTPVEAWTLGTSGTKIRTTFGEVTSYDETYRQTWTFAAAASKSITNSASPATITANATVTARGACLVSKNAKDGANDNSGYAIAGKRFSSDMPLSDDSEIRIVHTLSGSVS